MTLKEKNIDIKSDSFKLIDELSFCVLDLETTGGNHSKDKIIEIGMVKIKNLKVVDHKNFLINPETLIPEFIQKLTNISQKDVKNSPVIEDVIEEIVEFIGDDILVAHNTSFDIPFLNGVLSGLEMPELQNKVLCTNVMTRHLIPDILNSNLTYMSRLFSIKHSKAHRAHDDAVATAELLIIYLQIFIAKGIKKINQLYYPRNRFELDRLHLDNNHKNEEIVELIREISTSTVITIKGDKGIILAVIPYESSTEDSEFLGQILTSLDWTVVTVKLVKPILEGILQVNAHYMKFSGPTKEKIINFLSKKYIKAESTKVDLSTIDFLVAHHLINEQVLAYSFLNLSSKGQGIFKIPAQQKKMYQHLSSQIKRFEGVQKGRKKTNIQPEIVPILEGYISLMKDENTFLYLDRKSVKNDKEGTLKQIESFSLEHKMTYNFPLEHL